MKIPQTAIAKVVVSIMVVVLLFQGTSIRALGALDAEQSGNADKQAPAEKDKRIVAVLFSVGQNKDILKHFDGISNLDLLQVNGEPLIKHAYDALHRSRYIQKIIVVATTEVERALNLKEDPMTSFVPDRRDAATNVEFGIGEICKGDLIMFIPSDLPLVTPEGIDCLIERVLQDKSVDIVFPLIRRDIYESKYPTKERAYAHFREGQFTAEHVEFLRPDLFLDHVDQVAASKSRLYNVYYMRRNALGMVRFLGIGLTLKYLFGTLTTQDVEEHIYDAYRVRAKALFWDDPDLATDLSDPTDIPLINGALQRHALVHSQNPPASPPALIGAGI